MSAYVVDNEVINRILYAIFHALRNNDNDPEAILFPKPAGDLLTTLNPHDLGRLMRYINESAVMQRYDTYDIDKLPGRYDESGKMVRYKYVEEKIDNINELRMDLARFLYQCSEGNIVSDSLYKEIKDYYSIVYQIDNICANMRRERKRV
mgnify:CR=1 FL=1